MVFTRHVCRRVYQCITLRRVRYTITRVRPAAAARALGNAPRLFAGALARIKPGTSSVNGSRGGTRGVTAACTSIESNAGRVLHRMARQRGTILFFHFPTVTLYDAAFANCRMFLRSQHSQKSLKSVIAGYWHFLEIYWKFSRDSFTVIDVEILDDTMYCTRTAVKDRSRNKTQIKINTNSQLLVSSSKRQG